VTAGPGARRRGRPSWAPAWLAAGGAALVLAATAAAQQARVTLRPGLAGLGERVTYRAEVITRPEAAVRWLLPDSAAALTWGEPRVGRSRARRPGGRLDTTWIEASLQAFELGAVPVPGVRFEFRRHGGDPAVTMRAPTGRLVIAPVLAAADSDATLRPLHGPLAAPWWERVPWRWLAAAVLALLLALALGRARGRRRRAPDVCPEPALSPAARALAALAELRALRLPAQGRFAEHAFRLGQILRRYLESTVPTTRPGDSTPELVRHLGEAGLRAEDLGRLAGLLRVWDRVKFAREPFSVEEAARTEAAVEIFLRRGAAGETAEAA
jgi:hypothetical protein